jgi:hypothetical protein
LRNDCSQQQQPWKTENALQLGKRSTTWLIQNTTKSLDLLRHHYWIRSSTGNPFSKFFSVRSSLFAVCTNNWSFRLATLEE